MLSWYLSPVSINQSLDNLSLRKLICVALVKNITSTACLYVFIKDPNASLNNYIFIIQHVLAFLL